MPTTNKLSFGFKELSTYQQQTHEREKEIKNWTRSEYTQNAFYTERNVKWKLSGSDGWKFDMQRERT